MGYENICHNRFRDLLTELTNLRTARCLRDLGLLNCYNDRIQMLNSSNIGINYHKTFGY